MNHERIVVLHAQRFGVHELARRLNRAPSTISRELRRYMCAGDNENQTPIERTRKLGIGNVAGGRRGAVTEPARRSAGPRSRRLRGRGAAPGCG
ncbi:helix-turn-helix domain-containing protein [Rhodococcus sp. NPDC057014]|uniref:helix-turn-helix domain-containing protein n=1 Tax=Rhodococcus sp. NPDC057014 TaxID=3346000 RepID=UPI003641DF31